MDPKTNLVKFLAIAFATHYAFYKTFVYFDKKNQSSNH